MSENPTPEHRIPSRRAVVGAAALTVPAVVLAVTSPAHAGSDPGSVTMTFSSTLVRSGEAVNVTIVRKDASGQPLAGQSVTLSGTSGAWQFAARSGTTDATGTFRTQAIATGRADATATATATGSGGTASASQTVTFARRVLSVSVSPTSVAPGGKATVTVKVTDNAGKNWAGQSVSASASGGATLAASSGTTSYYGVWTTQITAPAASGSSTITAAYRDSDQNLTATATLTIS